jgi:hypothetical protein
VRLDDAPDRPGVSGDLERDPILLAEALGEELELLGLGRDPPRRLDLTPFGDRHLTEIDVDVQGDVSHLPLLSLTVGRTRGQTTSTHSRSERNRMSRRGGHRTKPGL